MILNLSKSQYVRGTRCPLLLWYLKNRRDIERVTSEKVQQIMEGGKTFKKVLL